MSRLERGHLGTLPVPVVRSVLGVVDAQLACEVRWRGGALDRLLDERHAALCQRVVEVLERFGWTALLEVTYSRYGERGSIDILAGESKTASLAVVEVKTEIASFEETQRRLDSKARLAVAIGEERFGWKAARSARILVVAENSVNRRAVSRHSALMAAVFPARTREVKQWLRDPQGSMAGLWMLPVIPRGTTNQDLAGSHRVRRTRTD